MIRRFNFTGRKDLPRSAVSVSVNGAPGPGRTFSATWNLAGFDLPDDARVYIEAYSNGSPTVLRFPFGQVSQPTPPASPALDEIESENVIFSFKVVDESENIGRLLAVVENISPRSPADEDDTGSHPILPILPEDLGQEVWRLNFANNRVVLEVNNRIDGIKDIARHDRAFFALVYPSVIRRILLQIVTIEAIPDPDGSLSDWRVCWLRWAIHWHPENSLPPQGDDEEARQAQLTWIDDVGAAFCNKHEVREKFIARNATEEER